MSTLLGSRLPIIAAPMAGGPSTVALAEAVTRAGGFAFLAAGNKTTAALAAEIERLRSSPGMRDRDFGVNLFAPPARSVDPSEFRDYVDRLQPEALALGVELDPLPRSGDDEWRQKFALLLEHPVPVVSVTFGLPTRDEVVQLQARGSRVFATVTSPLEAVRASALGVDAITVQGYRAGGHSAVHDPAVWAAEVEIVELLHRVREAVDTPLIAAGGVDGPTAVRELLDAGAAAVAVGTLLLRTDEAGTSPLQREALANPRFDRTELSRAFTGRPARGLHNGFTERNAEFAPVGYPEVHYLTRPLRQAATEAGDAERVHLWAGTGYEHAPDGPAEEVIAWLESQLR